MFSLSSRVFSRCNIQSSILCIVHCKHCTTSQKSRQPLQSDNLNSPQKNDFYGQPTPYTHPHLMKEGELIPGIELNEFKERRNRLMHKVVSTTHNRYHLAVIPSAPKIYMTEKIPYVFRQNSDFLYLTGCMEPDSVLVLSGDSSENFKSTIFLRKRDPHSELWDGPRTELKLFLMSHMKSYPGLVLWYDYLNAVNTEVHSVMTSVIDGANGKQIWESPRYFTHQLRLIKSPVEQRLMQESCNIASTAVSKAMAVTRPGITEHQLFATVDYESRMKGAEILAYPPVVAAGNNATIIHYINNTQQTQSGDMVLMDAGCEYHGYVSDITRTWPVDGKFTDPQRVLYEIILALQLELIQISKNFPSLDDLFHFMCRSLGYKLDEAGVFSSNVPKDKLAQVAYEFCPHHVSHYLGMDVHDTALIKRSIPIKHGMVITIEPGVYISKNNVLARPEFRGMGIRIEDDILVTDSGPVVLSALCPKEIDEIEKIVSSSTY
ncbi:xaa-Pro aminopeptidase 3 isoform X2 [Lycorma delicatula]|uniref:xaa-Pro aminopeptidase 3 isoform X2 n=1 Tax=Lycorma delicatula TaxID=130591 RepID=UPI003F510FC0